MTKFENINDLTADTFSDILRDKWCGLDAASGYDYTKGEGPKINAISATKVDQGVLSDVYSVHIKYQIPIPNNQKIDGEQQSRTESNSIGSTPPSDWLVKFCRPDLNLSWMCRNETVFYTCLAPRIIKKTVEAGKNQEGFSSSRSLPFSIPKFLSGSDQHVILEKEKNIKTYPLSDGCPQEKIGFLLRSLAALHATCWEAEFMSPPLLMSELCNSTDEKFEEQGLVFPAGMGQRLPPLQKEGLFMASWRDTIEHMQSWDSKQSYKTLDADLIEFTIDLCQRLATLRLRDVHEKVHSHRVTCVHGDFHIANWLFPIPNASMTKEQQRKPILVDFATAGYGNPLIDLVFFMVVSSNDNTVSDCQLFLKQYYQLLIEYDSSLSAKISFSTLCEWLPWALLCQFMILIAYDGVCRDIAAAEENEQKRESQFQHFFNVNRRMILAIKSIDNWDLILSKLPVATPAEQQEAHIFCQKTPLVI